MSNQPTVIIESTGRKAADQKTGIRDRIHTDRYIIEQSKPAMAISILNFHERFFTIKHKKILVRKIPRLTTAPWQLKNVPYGTSEYTPESGEAGKLCG